MAHMLTQPVKTPMPVTGKLPLLKLELIQFKTTAPTQTKPLVLMKTAVPQETQPGQLSAHQELETQPMLKHHHTQDTPFIDQLNVDQIFI